jgi:hypothetical protein
MRNFSYIKFAYIKDHQLYVFFLYSKSEGVVLHIMFVVVKCTQRMNKILILFFSREYMYKE